MGAPTASRSCPAEAVVLDFVEGRPFPERDEVARHLTECEDCRRLVAVLASSRDGAPPADAELAPVAALLEPGTLIANKYEVVSVIGRGGMGVVVEALHRTLRQRVALKFLLGPLSRDPAQVARFFREARAAATLGSDHVVRVLDADWLPSGEPFIALELLAGRDLAAELRARGQLPIPEAVAHVLDACEALALAHKHGIIHRDIKPANLFLTRAIDGSALVKVLDFGIAKVNAAGETAATDPAAVVGSPRYMAPEQLRGGGAGVDARVDVWALGVTLFELITGRAPFDGNNLLEICAAIITGSPASLLELRPDAPASLAQALGQALERDADRRTATVLAFAEAIAPFAPPSSIADLERLRRIANAPPGHEPPSSRPALAATPAAIGNDATVAASPDRRAADAVPSRADVAKSPTFATAAGIALPSTPPLASVGGHAGTSPLARTVGVAALAVAATAAAGFFAYRSSQRDSALGSAASAGIPSADGRAGASAGDATGEAGLASPSPTVTASALTTSGPSGAPPLASSAPPGRVMAGQHPPHGPVAAASGRTSAAAPTVADVPVTTAAAPSSSTPIHQTSAAQTRK